MRLVRSDANVVSRTDRVRRHPFEVTKWLEHGALQTQIAHQAANFAGRHLGRQKVVLKDLRGEIADMLANLL